MSADFSTLSTRDVYGPFFCKIIGENIIDSLPKISAEELGLSKKEGELWQDTKYWSRFVAPDAINKPCRFIDPSGRPGIALPITAYTNDNVPLAKFVELVFKRYSLNGDGGKERCREDHYVTTCGGCNIKVLNELALGKIGCEPDRTYIGSQLYNVGGMNTEELNRVKELLNGKTISGTTFFGDKGYLKISPNELEDQKHPVAVDNKESLNADPHTNRRKSRKRRFKDLRVVAQYCIGMPKRMRNQ